MKWAKELRLLETNRKSKLLIHPHYSQSCSRSSNGTSCQQWDQPAPTSCICPFQELYLHHLLRIFSTLRTTTQRIGAFQSTFAQWKYVGPKLSKGPLKEFINHLQNLNRVKRAFLYLCGIHISPLVKTSHLVRHSPHNSLTRWNSHEPRQQSPPQSKQTFFSKYCPYSMKHALVLHLTPCSGLGHKPGLHHIKWAGTNGASSACKKPRHHRLPWLKGFSVSLVFFP